MPTSDCTIKFYAAELIRMVVDFAFEVSIGGEVHELSRQLLEVL